MRQGTNEEKGGYWGPRSNFDLLASSSSGYIKRSFGGFKFSWPLKLALVHVGRDVSVSLFEMPHSAESCNSGVSSSKEYSKLWGVVRIGALHSDAGAGWKHKRDHNRPRVP